jgi:uncharacterized membrane protein YbhN (UPF0104 family)
MLPALFCASASYNPGMNERWRPWLAWGKALLALLIVVGVVWFFVRVLQSPELQQADQSRTPWEILRDEIAAARPGPLVLSGALYLAGLGFWAAFWILLLHWVKDPLPLSVAIRSYYIAHLGKYAPLGKGWALLLRVALAVQGGIRTTTAAVTSAYETLTSMASGALLAAILLLLELGGDRGLLWPALLLLALAGVPILPGVFNFLVDRVSARFRTQGQPPPRLGTGTLLVGLVLSGLGWVLLGASLAATLWALDPALVDDPVRVGLRCAAFVSVSYVAGFLASTPGGLGVRELVLQQLLAPTLGVRAVVVVILLRILWTVAELVAASVVVWLPRGPVKVPAPVAEA